MDSTNTKPLVLDYLQGHLIINKTLFWSLLSKYIRKDLILRIEAELAIHKEDLGVTELYYVNPIHSLAGLDAFFKDKPQTSNYLTDYRYDEY